MKIKGKKIEGPAESILVLSRNEEEIVITARAVLEYDQFHAIIPVPEAPIKTLKGGAKVPDYESKEYIAQMNDYGRLKTQWMCLKSLSATEIEWDTVDMADPSTWGNYETDLKNAGFSEVERQRILNTIIDANCLNETKLDEARERFLSGLKLAAPQSNGSSFHKDAAQTTPLGELAKGSESGPQT